MSNYLRNLKISAHLAFKPCIFRAQSYPTIGFYSCVENVATPKQSVLSLNFSVNELGLLGSRSSEKQSRPSPNAETSNEISKRRSTSSRDIARSHTKTKSSLSIYRVPSDSLFKLNSTVRAEKDASFVLYSPRLPGDISASFLCEQIRKDNVAIFSGCSDASPYHIFCVGAEDGIPPKVTLSSQLEGSALRFSETRKPPQKDQPTGKPSEEQLHNIHSALAENLPKFFKQAHNYRLYNQDIIFENNVRGITTRGLSAYMQQLTLIRVLGHLKFAHVKMEIFKMTQHPEDGTVRVRWRVVGMPGMRLLFMFWNFRFWQVKKLLNKQSEWYDGFSIFHVGSDGLIYKHVCDKMMPDENRETAKVRDGDMAMKLALVVGLAPELTGRLLGGLDSAIMTMGRIS